jgi:multiple sugar transport system ATP-binding protein
MTGITLSKLTKRFDDVTAVSAVDLSVRDGEFLVLVGPSGCGKSTTLRLVSGLESPTSGTIEFGERDVTALDPPRRNVSMVFQNYALYPHMTARENMTFGADSSTDLTAAELDERVADAAATLDIADLLERKPAALSGGEKQRVAIGRALIRDPDVFLMDEPLSNLDAKLRVQMRAELQELHAELGTTTVYVTHDQVEAMTLGDRVAVMYDGHLQQVDRPQAVYDFPVNRFVAEFIGSPGMNAFPVELSARGDGDGDGLRARWDDSAVRLPRAPDELAGESATLGVRPEDLHRDPEGGVRFTPRVTEPLGERTLVHGTAGDAELTVEFDARSEVSTGEPVALAPDDSRLHLFDRETGAALHHSDPARDAPADARGRDADGRPATPAAADGGSREHAPESESGAEGSP